MMNSHTKKTSDIEIVSPAGNLEKLKIAVKYGADAVYFGGEGFNLRDKAANFSIDEIEEGVNYCRNNGVKSIFLLNSFLHENDIENAGRYIETIREQKFDAVMISDPGMLMLLREADISADIHLSTQMSTLNHLAVKFWTDIGIKRIVLARETGIDEIKKIRGHTDAEIEIFVHGALCISYSGRCLLSRYLSGRDANQGACSHPCRWKYALVEEKRPGSHMEIIEHANGTEILSSKDLCLISRLSDYIDAGVNAFKIEGRMKSLYYTANVTRIYKNAVQNITKGKDIRSHLEFYNQELDLVSHRPYTDDLFNEFDNLGFTDISYIKKVLFLGYKTDTGTDPYEAEVKVFNPMHLNEEIEAIFPIKNGEIADGKFRITEIIDNDEYVDMARPGKTCHLRFDKALGADAVFRRRL